MAIWGIFYIMLATDVCQGNIKSMDVFLGLVFVLKK